MPVDFMTMGLNEALALLPTTSADDVAAFLQREGIKGWHVSPRRCPLAVFFSRATGVPCAVGSTWVAVEGAQVQFVSLPAALADFVRTFDHGKHRELAG